MRGEQQILYCISILTFRSEFLSYRCLILIFHCGIPFL